MLRETSSKLPYTMCNSLLLHVLAFCEIRYSGNIRSLVLLVISPLNKSKFSQPSGNSFLFLKNKKYFKIMLNITAKNDRRIICFLDSDFIFLQLFACDSRE